MTNIVAHQGKFNRVERDNKNPMFSMGIPEKMKGSDFAKIGLGAGDDLYSQIEPIIDSIRNRKNCTMLVMPNVEHAKIVFNGPQSDNNIGLLLGDKFDPLGIGPVPPVWGSYDTTLAQPSQSQTHMIICAIGWHIRPEPLCWTATGNAYTPAVPAVAKPISPDFFTTNDQTVVPPGGSTEQIPTGMIPASLEWGWWSNYAAWLMVAAYNLRWQMGQNTNIIFDELRNTAYMPPNSQDGSASSSLVDISLFVEQVNQFYQQFNPGGPQFLKADTVRLGSVGATAANVSAFTPSRDLERVEATYGGMGLREMLKGNSEFRPLATPVAWPAGVPFGFYAEAANTNLLAAMQQYFSITDSGQGTPATFNDNPALFTAGGTTPSFLERTLDGVNALLSVPSQRSTFKGGRLIVEVKFKGFEISEDLYTTMKNHARIRDMICSECGLSWFSR